jgi:hypothetical protein
LASFSHLHSTTVYPHFVDRCWLRFNCFSGKAFAVRQAVGGCSTSAHIVIAARSIAASTVAPQLAVCNYAPPISGINGLRKVNSIIATANATTVSGRRKRLTPRLKKA